MKVIVVRDDDSLDSKEFLIKCVDMYIDLFLELI